MRTMRFENGIEYRDDQMQRHRSGGPAIEYDDGGREHWINGVLHHESEPAVQWADGTRQWWINGIRLSEAEHAAVIANVAAGATLEIDRTDHLGLTQVFILPSGVEEHRPVVA